MSKEEKPKIQYWAYCTNCDDYIVWSLSARELPNAERIKEHKEKCWK